MLCSLLVWCISIVFSLQAFVFRQVTFINNTSISKIKCLVFILQVLNEPQAHCSWLFPGELDSDEHEFWLNVQFISRFGFAYILPLIVITYCYTSIFLFLRKRRFKESSKKSKRQGLFKFLRPPKNFSKKKIFYGFWDFFDLKIRIFL